jgi:uncharacterized protein
VDPSARQPSARKLSHVVGFDDEPFPRPHRGDVGVIGVVYAGPRLEGVLRGKVRRDGTNSTYALARMIEGSRYQEHLQAIFLQGIALAGFNVLDIHKLAARTGLGVLVVARKAPDMAAVRHALHEKVPGGAKKWRLIERAGPMEAAHGVYVQRAGLSLDEAKSLLERFSTSAQIPEPLRAAHLIAGAVARGHSSKGRA